jgi:AraC-like DNA-binding protein
MNNISENKIHLDKMWGLFIGQFNENILHKHYALQICISSKSYFNVIDEHHNRSSHKTCFINSNIPHALTCTEPTLILLINPISRLGYQLYQKFKTTQITSFDEALRELTIILNSYINSDVTFSTLITRIRNYLNDLTCVCETENHFDDDRIYKGIQYLEMNFQRNVSLEEIAHYCCLSESRFLHLFKEKTNLTFRRYQLWNKLIKSLPYLKNHSITEAAHAFGFTDNSHYTRTFKETFGLKPTSLSFKD